MALLQINDARKSFGKKTVLKGIDLQCRTGEILGIFGRNGCGKSTLLKLIYGVEKADKMELYIDGTRIDPRSVIPMQRVAYLPQESFLPKDLTVRNVIPLFVKEGDRQDSIFYAPGIAKIDHKSITNLSLGEKRYLEVLMVGQLQHDFIMLDEPFSMIEPQYREYIQQLLKELVKKKGIIITDHYYSDVLNVSDSCFLIKDGLKFDIQNKNDLVTAGYLRQQVHI